MTIDGEPDPLDFGSGVTGRFVDADGLPDGEHWGLIHTHPRPDGNGTCSSSLMFDGPAQRERDPDRPRWVVEQLGPLTLSPSILCSPSKGGCGIHGYIREGRWVTA